MFLFFKNIMKFWNKKNNINDIIKKIVTEENIKIKKSQINQLYNSSDGDLRKIINTLEKFKYFSQDLNSIPNLVNLNLVYKYFDYSLNNNITKLLETINLILNQGYTASEIIINILDIILDCQNISEINKCCIFYNISYIDYNLNNGCDDLIQLIKLSNIIFNI